MVLFSGEREEANERLRALRENWLMKASSAELLTVSSLRLRAIRAPVAYTRSVRPSEVEVKWGKGDDEVLAQLDGELRAWDSENEAVSSVLGYRKECSSDTSECGERESGRPGNSTRL